MARRPEESPPAYHTIFGVAPPAGRAAERGEHRVSRPRDEFESFVRRQASERFKKDPAYSSLRAGGFTLPLPSESDPLWEGSRTESRDCWKLLGLWNPSWQTGNPGVNWLHEESQSATRSPRQTTPLFGTGNEPPRDLYEHDTSHLLTEFCAHLWLQSFNAKGGAPLDDIIDTLFREVKRDWRDRGFDFSVRIPAEERPPGGRNSAASARRSQSGLQRSAANDEEATPLTTGASAAGRSRPSKRKRTEREEPSSAEDGVSRDGGRKRVRLGGQGPTAAHTDGTTHSSSSRRLGPPAPRIQEAQASQEASSSVSPSEPGLPRGRRRKAKPSASAAPSDARRREDTNSREFGVAAPTGGTSSASPRRSLRLQGGGPSG